MGIWSTICRFFAGMWTRIKRAFHISFDAERFVAVLIEDILADRPDLYRSPGLFNAVLLSVSSCGLSDEDYHAVYVEVRRQTIVPHGVVGDVVSSVGTAKTAKSVTVNPDG